MAYTENHCFQKQIEEEKEEKKKEEKERKKKMEEEERKKKKNYQVILLAGKWVQVEIITFSEPRQSQEVKC